MFQRTIIITLKGPKSTRLRKERDSLMTSLDFSLCDMGYVISEDPKKPTATHPAGMTVEVIASREKEVV